MSARPSTFPLSNEDALKVVLSDRLSFDTLEPLYRQIKGKRVSLPMTYQNVYHNETEEIIDEYAMREVVRAAAFAQIVECLNRVNPPVSP